MAKNIKRTVLSEKSPRNRHIAWAEPKGENIQLNIFNDGKWRPVAGGGSNSSTVTKYTSDPDAPMLDVDIIQQQIEIIAEEFSIGPDSQPTAEQMEQMINELKSVKFATPRQGNAVLVNYDLESNILTFQCDDGSIITYNGEQFIGLRPDIDGYIIWKTTRDKLPVRESQEETDPVTDPEEPNPGDITTKSVKSGLLGVVQPTDPSTEEVYTVINNNTGEIVDPLELHKLTNIIWYWNEGYLPLYVSNATDVNSILHPLPISEWVPLNTNSGVKYAYTFYDYTITLSDE